MDHLAELDARMLRPQRHRLLQGYPAFPLMRSATGTAYPLHLRGPDGGVRRVEADELWHVREPEPDGGLRAPHITVDRSRPLLVGVLPHTQCVPHVEGCGFCTFPHDAPNTASRKRVARGVAEGVDELRRHPDALDGRRVAAMYFGGGTANLSAVGELDAIFRAVAAQADVSDAEVTLEGVPSLFASWLYAPLRWLDALPVRSRRVSLGVQTFDPAQIDRMGRTAFGDRRTVEGLVRRAQSGGVATSVDLLFDLPFQTRAQMLDDVTQAVETGVDQVCLYHLVLYAGLGTPWSRDPALLAALPSTGAAVDNWLALREALLAAGFVQTTLTNFERRDAHESRRRFLYEEASFTPETYDGLGVGPLSVSTFVDVPARRAVKLSRAKRVGSLPWSMDDLAFDYDEPDLSLLFFTRMLARAEIARPTWRRVFGRDLVDDHGAAIEACRTRGLVTLDDEALRLTPRGMFFADAVVGTASAERTAALRSGAGGVHTLDALHAPMQMGGGISHLSMG